MRNYPGVSLFLDGLKQVSEGKVGIVVLNGIDIRVSLVLILDLKLVAFCELDSLITKMLV